MIKEKLLAEGIKKGKPRESTALEPASQLERWVGHRELENIGAVTYKVTPAPILPCRGRINNQRQHTVYRDHAEHSTPHAYNIHSGAPALRYRIMLQQGRRREKGGRKGGFATYHTTQHVVRKAPNRDERERNHSYARSHSQTRG